MPLTDLEIRRAKPAEKPYRLTDGGGLHLYITPGGSKLWRYRYEFGGKEKLLSLGAWPKMSLSDARQGREQARAVLKARRDPGLERQLRKAGGIVDPAATFEAVARIWYAKARPAWSERHAADVLGSLESMVFPVIGAFPIKDITPPVVLSVLHPIEARPAIETARRVRQRMSAVFVYAISSGLAENDPAAIVKGAMAPLVKGRQPAITDLNEARAMLAKAEAEPAHPSTRLALRFLALTAVRPGNICGALWGELEGIDGQEPLWRIPPGRMKAKEEHQVPLARQAVEIIAAAKTVSAGSPFLFPNTRHTHRPMSENAIGYLLNRAGYHHRHVPHGWRSTFSTVMNEHYPADRAVIDLMLAHAPKDRVEGAYNRASHMKRRRELAQIWADMILKDVEPASSLLGGARR